MIGTVYLIRNTVNGLVYVGRTIRTMDQRWHEHCRNAVSGTARLYRAIREFGDSAFTIEELARSDSHEELRQLEESYIGEYRASEPEFGYNTMRVAPFHFPYAYERVVGKTQRAGKIPLSVLEDKQLSMSAKCVYAMIDAYALRDESGMIPQRAIAKKLGISLNTVNCAVSELLDSGHIRRRPQFPTKAA